jgi:sodium/pantothenate symporter
VTEIAGMPWLAGLLVAAPFAAVMSTMDSFLLMNASAITRDIYHRVIRPQASERELKHLTWAATLGIGLIAMIAALNPPKFLQDVIVYTSSGLSTCFLAPVFFCLYWRRFNLTGAFSSLLGGFFIYNVLYGVGYAQTGFTVMKAVEPLGLHPFLVGTASSFVFGIVGTLLTPPPAESIVRKFFYVKDSK